MPRNRKLLRPNADRTIPVHPGLNVTVDTDPVGIAPPPRILRHLQRYALTAAAHSGYFDSTALHTVAPNHCKATYDVNNPWHIRRPEPVERAASARLARRFSEATVAGQTRTKVASQLPPGRIHVPSVVNNRLTRASGRPASDPMFRRREISRVVRAPLQVAVVKDLTHSMATFSMLGASLSWVVDGAIQQLGGTVTQVDFNHGAWPWQAPGERLPGVLQTATIGPRHSLGKALSGVEAATQFIGNPVGPRILVLFTDFRFDKNESRALPFFADAGVHVVAVTPAEPWAYTRPGGRFTAVSGTDSIEYDDMVDSIGDAIIESIEADKLGQG